MLKINVKSFQEGIKELSKIKSKESYINLVNEGNDIYLTKLLLNDLGEIATYKLDAELSIYRGINYEILDNMIKAILKLKEDTIEIMSLDENKIELSTNKRKITFKTGSYKFNNNLLNFGPIEQFSLSSDEFKTLLQVTEYAAKDQVRPVLQGVNFKENKVCSLDGYRLALREFKSMDLKNSYTVFANTISSLSAIIKKNSNILFAFSESQCRIKIDRLTITTDLLKGDYIKYNSLIPDEFKVIAELDQAELKEEIDFIISLSDDKDHTIAQFNMDKKQISILNKSQLSSSTINLEKASCNGDLEIAFNANYINNMLKHFNNKITFKMNRNNDPIVCENKLINGLDLILPIRIYK